MRSRRLAVFGGLLFAIVAVVVSSAIPVLAASPSRLLTLPFEIHAERDLSFLNNGIQAMLRARLTHDGRSEVVRSDQPAAGEAEALKMGAAQGADYVVAGSLTFFGSSVSTDAVLIDVASGKALVRFSESGTDSGDVIRHIDRFAQLVNRDIFGLGAKPHEEQAGKPAPITAAPKAARAAVPMPVGGKGLEAPAVAAGAAPVARIAAAPVEEEPQIWKSNRIAAALCGLTAGDVNGDGRSEVVVIDSATIFVYRLEEDNLVQLAIYKADQGDRLIGVDAADINLDSKAEIYVTAMGGGRLASFVLEWDGSRLRRIARDFNWYFRVIDSANGAKRLVGQQRGLVETTGVPELEDQNRLFRGGVVELVWRGDRLVEGDRIPLPEGTSVFGFSVGDALNDGRQLIVGFDAKNYLVVIGDDGRREYKSAGAFGGSLNYLEYSSSSQFSHADRFYLPLRVHLADLDGDGKMEIVTARNEDAARSLLSRYRSFSKGQVVGLGWEKIAMKEKWATDVVTDFVVDTAVADLSGDGRSQVIFVVSTSGGFLEAGESYVVTYRP